MSSDTNSDFRDAEVFAAYPGVLIDRDNIAHYRGLMTQRLLINRCEDCGYWVYPHRPMCPQCWSWNLNPSEVSGRGTIFMFTLIQQERDPQERLRAPLIAAAIELAEQSGLRYLSRLVDCAPESVTHDMPVQLTWIERPGLASLPAFKPITERG